MKNVNHFFYLIVILTVISGCKKSPVQDEPDQPKPISIGEFIDDWTFRVNPYGNFDIGEFRLWLPDSTDDLRAILVLSNYHNSYGLGLASNDEWQTYAKQEKLAILAVHLESFPNSQGYYSYASGGSGSALLKALDSLAQRHQIEKLLDLPFLLRGYSAGGVFSYHFSDYQPQRVIAFANIRGGSLNVTEPENKIIPGLMLGGENDAATRNERIAEIVLSKRNEGANWAYAIEPNEDHFGSVTNSDKLIRAFFSKALAKRKIEGSNQLIAISEDSGWLGNNETQEIFSFDSYPTAKSEASWLIDEDFALLWKDYQQE